MSPLFLHWVNVVILAQFHNPSILNPDFLSMNGIVPSDWRHTETLTTPAFSLVKYPANVDFNVDRDRLTIQKNCDGEFKDGYCVHDFAAKYVRTLSHLRYTSVGLNWHLSLEKQDNEEWITERFVRRDALEGTESKVLQSAIKLAFEAQDAICTFDISPGKAKVPKRDEPYSAVIVNVNFHHQGPFTSQQIDEITRHWKYCEDYARQLLSQLLGKIS